MTHKLQVHFSVWMVIVTTLNIEKEYMHTAHNIESISAKLSFKSCICF